MTLAKEGIPFVGISAVLSLLLGWFFNGIVALPAWLLTLYILYFFRDPKRKSEAGPEMILSPADGKILEVTEVQEERYLKRRVRKVSIFMSLLNVHINRVPFSGRVKGVTYHPGQFLIGFAPKASLENEQNAILLETSTGKELLMVQIAGFVARRIICYLKGGEEVGRGQKLGLIRFGSRVDLYCPLECQIAVRPGEVVRGGETILGRFSL